jgi:hypothetical protein
VEIDGTLTLLFKNSDWTYNGKVPFTGEFEGQGTKFTVWEDAVPVLYKKLLQPGMTISYHKVQATRVTNLAECTNCVVPLRSVAVATSDFASNPFGFLGSGAITVSGEPTNVGIEMLPGLKGMLATPGFNVLSAAYFRIPVEGELEDDANISIVQGRPMCDRANHVGHLQLRVDAAKNDWDPDLINAHARYSLLTVGLPLAVPLILDFGLPYPSAEFILKRALGNTTPAQGHVDDRTFVGTPGEMVYTIAETAVELVVDPGTTGRPVHMDDVKDPRTGLSTDTPDCSVLAINYQHQNAMPRTKVADADNNKTGQASYSITLNLVGGPGN